MRAEFVNLPINPGAEPGMPLFQNLLAQRRVLCTCDGRRALGRGCLVGMLQRAFETPIHAVIRHFRPRREFLGCLWLVIGRWLPCNLRNRCRILPSQWLAVSR